MAFKQYTALLKDLQSEIDSFDISLNVLEELYHEMKELNSDFESGQYDEEDLDPLYDEVENGTKKVMKDLLKVQGNIEEMQNDFVDMEDKYGELSTANIIAIRNKIHILFEKFKKQLIKVRRLRRYIDDSIKIPWESLKDELKQEGRDAFTKRKEYKRTEKKHNNKKQVKIRDPQKYARLKPKKFADDAQFDPYGVDIDKLHKLYSKLSKEQQEAFKKLDKIAKATPEQQKMSDTLKSLLQKRVNSEGGKGNFLELLGNGKYRKNRRNRKNRKHKNRK